MTKIDILPGTEFRSYAFGNCHVRRVYTHPDTHETVLDVKSELGNDMHWSLKYGRKLRDEGRMVA